MPILVPAPHEYAERDFDERIRLVTQLRRLLTEWAEVER